MSDLRPRKRSRKGCLTCRARKVKCSEGGGPVCAQCINLELECRWMDATTQDAPRRQGACEPCRIAKSRCDKGSPCDRCSTLKVDCVYNELRQRQQQEIEWHEAPPSSSSAELHEILDTYFARIHPMESNGFIHRADLMRDIADGTAPTLLVQSIRLVTGRFMPDADHTNADGGKSMEQLAKDVKTAIMADTDRFSLFKLAAVLNLLIHETSSGRHASTWLLVALATRMCFAMGLHNENPGSFSDAEGRRRMMWAAFAADSQSAGGIDEYVLTERRHLKLALPSSERAFALNLPVQGRHLQDVELDERPGPEGTDGIFHRYIRLIAIRNDILGYTKYITTFPGHAWEEGSRFDVLCRKLKCWRTSLPADLEFNLDSLYAQKGQGGNVALASLHIWYDQLHCTLYRLAFPGFDESAPAEYLALAPPDWVDKLRRGCNARAIEVRQKLRFLVKHHPSFVPSGWRLCSYVYESIRNQLAFLAYAYPNGEPDAQKKETLAGFTEMTNVMLASCQYVYAARYPARVTLKLLERHGYKVQSNWPISDMETAPPSPGVGPVLSRLPYLQKHLRHPNAEQRVARQQSVSEARDPVTQAPLSTSPAADSPALPIMNTLWTEQESDLLQDYFAPPLGQPSAIDPSFWSDNQTFNIGAEAEPFFSAEFWTAQAPLGFDATWGPLGDVHPGT